MLALRAGDLNVFYAKRTNEICLSSVSSILLDKEVIHNDIIKAEIFALNSIFIHSLTQNLALCSTSFHSRQRHKFISVFSPLLSIKRWVFFFLNGAAREIAQFVCLPGMNKTLGSVFSTAYSGVLVQTLLSRLSEGRGRKIRKKYKVILGYRVTSRSIWPT